MNSKESHYIDSIKRDKKIFLLIFSLILIISVSYYSYLNSTKTVTITISNISNKFTVDVNLTHKWVQETRSDEAKKIKYIAYGVHSGTRGKYEKFLMWKYLKLEDNQTSFTFSVDIQLKDDIMVEAMGYSKHVDLGDSYNTLEYYLVVTGGLSEQNNSRNI